MRVDAWIWTQGVTTGEPTLRMASSSTRKAAAVYAAAIYFNVID